MPDKPPPPDRRQDLPLVVLSVMLILALIAAAFWLLRPFLMSIIWAAMIVVATWPLMLRVQAALGRRSLAVVVMSISMLAVFVVPLALAIQSVADHMDTITAFIRALPTATVPPPPAWLADLPLVGAQAAEYWTKFAGEGMHEIGARLAPYAANAAQWTATAFGSIGSFVIHVLMTVVIAVVMYAHGEAAREGLIRFGRRVSGERGEAVVVLAGQAIRGVALGVVVTALVQSILSGIGLALSGVPFAGLLTGVILLCCIAQIGPSVILVPAVIWLFWTDSTAWGSVMVVWTLVVSTMDNFIRPVLIRRGADLPLLLIFAGVIGGLISFGIVGLFVGPVLLAVLYKLLGQWMAEGERG